MIKVLIVEDHLVNLFTEALNLLNGFEFTTVSKAEFALGLLRKEHFDIVLMDLRMPGMGGLEGIRQIRKSSNIPIIAMTAWTDRRTRQAALEAGANEYFAKPLRFERLYQKIIELIAEQPLENRTEETMRRRLHILEQKKALMGGNTPPEVLIEIEDLRKELKI